MLRLVSVVLRLVSVVLRLVSVVLRLVSIVLWLVSVVLRLVSVVLRLVSVVLRLVSVLLRLVSVVLRLVSIVLRLVSIVLWLVSGCVVACFRCAATCFRCVVLISLCCGWFPFCCDLFLLCCNLFPLCCNLFPLCYGLFLLCCGLFLLCCGLFPLCCGLFPLGLHNLQAHGFSYHCYADDTQLYLSFQPDDPTVAARISGCLADNSAWMKEHHLQLNLAKTELLVVPATPTLQHDFSIQLGTSIITPSTSVRNLGVIFDDQLTFKEHIAKTARSCRFALHNIRKIRPFLTEHAAQLLVQALVVSRLDYCNALLAGLPSNTIKPLQMIQNAAARLVFNEPKRTHVTPLFISLHWLPVAARIKFKTLMLAYRTTTGSAPSYFHSLLRIYIPSRSLRSASERRLVVPSQRGSKSLSRTFSFTIPGWWNNLPTPIRNAGSLSIFKQQLKTHLFRHYLTSS